jgi:hypothetical protein
MAVAATISIGGSARSMRDGSLRVIENINGRSTLTVDIISPTGSYSPNFDDAVVLTDASAAVLMGGYVTAVEKRWIKQGAVLQSTVTATDYTGLCDRMLVAATAAAGSTVRAAVDAVIAGTIGPAFGVTRDAGMAAGATLGALTYDYATVTEVFNDLTRLAAPSGWVWYIDSGKVLRGYLPSLGARPCPFSLTTGSSKIAGGDIEITKTRDGYANRVYMTYGDGTATTAMVTAQNTTEQAAYGIYEKVIRADGPLTSTAAQALVDAYLARAVAAPRTIKFRTRSAGAHPGQTVTVNITGRVSPSADFLITSVETTDFDGKELFFDITAIEGAVLAGDWKDTFRAWGSGGNSGLVSSSVTIVTTAVGRASYFLGGSGIAAEQSAGPSVIDAVGYIDVMLDTAALPGVSVTCVVQCKTAAGGVGVTPQVYNVTDATVAGTGSTVTGTTWQTVSFAVTLAAGQKVYRLRMTPSAANVDCFTLGYLEVGR